MFFIHEIDLAQKTYREIITCDPYVVLFHAGRSCTNDRYKVLVRETENFYDIFEQKERDLSYMFYITTEDAKVRVLRKKKLDDDTNPCAVFAALVYNCQPLPQKTYVSNDVRIGRKNQDTLVQFHINTDEKPLKNEFGLSRFQAIQDLKDAIYVLCAHSSFNTQAEFIVNLNEVKMDKTNFYYVKYFTQKYSR